MNPPIPEETKEVDKGGRPTKYDPKYNEEVVLFFDVPKNKRYVKSEKTTTKSNGTTETWTEWGYMAEDLPTLEKFARLIGVNGDTLVEWAKDENKEKYPGFSAAYNTAKELQKEFLTDNALKGLYPPASFIFIAKNITTMRDKTAMSLSGEEEGNSAPIEVVFRSKSAV